MSTVSECRKQMYQKCTKWIKDAITYTQSVIDRYQPNSDSPDINKERRVVGIDPRARITVAEILENSTIIMCSNKEESERSRRDWKTFKKELAHAYAVHCFNIKR